MSAEKKEIDIIKERCEANDLKIYQVFRVAGESAHTITNWTRKNPEQFEIRNKIHATIDKLIAEKQGV